jgi:uncharacterized membrane protein YkoI
MKQKTALFISIAMTAFVLVVLSAVAMRAPTFLDAIAGQKSDPTSDPSIEQVIAEREQQYIDALNKANQQISEMQAQIDVSIPTETPQNETITAEEAAMIGQDAAMEGFTLAGLAELVDYEGQLAYEVPFNDGQIYIDARTGDVLFNGTIVYGPTTIFASDAARIASDYMKRQDAVNVMLVTRVAFPGSNFVYVSKYGSLLEVQLASTVSSAASEHDDDHDDREDHDDDD